LGWKIKGRGHQPFPNKMKYHWPKVSVQLPLKRLGSVLGRLPFFKNLRQILYKVLVRQSRVVCWVGYPFSSVDGHHCWRVIGITPRCLPHS